jgi:hypothetical protein
MWVSCNKAEAQLALVMEGSRSLLERAANLREQWCAELFFYLSLCARFQYFPLFPSGEKSMTERLLVQAFA